MLKVNARAAGCHVNEDQPPLDGIIIETTGLADPGPVCKTFFAEEDILSRTRIDGVLTVVDACHFLSQVQRIRSDGAVNESAQQVAFADKLLLNKVNLATEAHLQLVETEIRRLNEICPIFRCNLVACTDQLPLDRILGSETFSLDRVLQDLGEASTPDVRAAKKPRTEADAFCAAFKPKSRHDSGIATCAITIEGAPVILQRFLDVMNSLRTQHASDLYRYKGIVCVKEETGGIKRSAMQGVHDMCMFQPRGVWPAEMPHRSELVFIGRNLDEALWKRLFEKTKEGALGE